MTGAGEVTHPNSALAKSSRAKLFAADYADAEARRRTMIRKKELETEALANMHDGRISVSSKTETDLDSTRKKRKAKTKPQSRPPKQKMLPWN
ncbi:MAG: hypothetical protein KAU94_04430 [Verrucomicrobia bacterium]|nr:hypothetical protein [Verrucomicrobiota bacterium]